MREEIFAAVNTARLRMLAAAKNPATKQVIEQEILDLRTAISHHLNEPARKARLARADRASRRYFTIDWRSTGKREVFNELKNLSLRLRLSSSTIQVYLSKGRGKFTRSMLPDEHCDGLDEATITERFRELAQ